ncbi:hypothetical protein M513_10511 [Trichuris suis]|uniref:Uncharacterized protein n=1 Tax=Trichuris suis TaxID=68888 RepID=A0A085LUD1_9BILA|nr:hypothetical protein M513_10511 [Trichuris suis]
MVKAAEVLAEPLRQTVARFSNIRGGATAQHIVNHIWLMFRSEANRAMTLLMLEATRLRGTSASFDLENSEDFER